MQKAMSLIAVMLLALACQQAPEQDSYTDEGKQATFVGGAGGAATRSLVTIPISVKHGAFALSGTNATNYTVTLDDDPVGNPGVASTCLSAYTATVDETNLDGIEVYKDDRNCLAKLTEFTTADGSTYNATNAGATDFTTWLANDTAIFTTSGGAKIRVKVISQLSSPIAGTEAVVYNFSELIDGDGDYVYSEAEVSDPHLITVQSQEAPHFNIVAANYTGMNDTSGAAQFTFKMECVDDPAAASPTSVAMTNGSASDTLCGLNDLADIEYKLVKDTFTPPLTITDAEDAFVAPVETVSIPGDQYQDSATNEGFMTTTLDGPGPLGTTGNEHMILFIRAGLSYTYFDIDVTTITQ